MMNLISEWKFDQVNVPSTDQTPDSWSGGNICILKQNSYVGVCDLTHCPQLQTTGCVFGNCFSFDGTDDYIDAGSNTNLKIEDKSFTIEAWIKPATNISNGSRFTLMAAYTPGWILDLPDDTNVEGYRFYDGATAYKYIPSGNLISLSWTHWTVTRDLVLNNLKIYLNGELKQTWSLTSIVASTNPLLIGRRTDGLYFNGLIDDIRIYDVAIATSQIKENYYVGLNSLLTKEQINAREYSQRINLIAEE